MTADDDSGSDTASPSEQPEEEDPGWPWSFLILIAAGAAYLIFRFIELGIKIFS